MMHFNYSLKPYNSFGIDVLAKKFSGFSSLNELGELIETEKGEPKKMILGGGSNLLFTQNFNGLVLKNDLKGIQLISEDAEYVYVEAAGGENWHRFVLYCIANNYAGAENLSLIPGNIGASPMQNIGAYGVELKDIFFSLKAFHLEEKSMTTFSKADCDFGYRDSIFKKRYKNKFAITSVVFRLNKIAVFNTSYGAIREELDKMNIAEITIRSVSDAVINIRRSKLPDPAVIGNAGSFFKNPTISKEEMDVLKTTYPGIPFFELADQTFKLPAGWLIEQCGWKGYRSGDAGCHAKQALVLVNFGNASGQQIFDLSEQIKISVQQKFSINLEREVNVC